MTLFFKECKKVLFSITYVILVVTIVLFVYAQDVFPRFDRVFKEPLPTEQGFGVQPKEEPSILMPAAIDSLFNEFSHNQYTTYPIGFYKNIKLNNKKQAQIADSISAITGVAVDEIKQSVGSNTNVGTTIDIGDGNGLIAGEDGGYTITLPEEGKDSAANITSVSPKAGLDYEAFRAEMARVDDILGGGSKYSETQLVMNFSQVPITYEEALEDYNLIKNYDKFTGTYARLFCDYLGMMIGLLPVFVAVVLCMKDRRSKMQELIYARRASSLKIVASRYFAIVLMVMIPVIIINYISNASMWGAYAGEVLDYLAPLKYSLGWLLPSVMISTAVGMFFTVLTDTPIAIAIQGFWWFINMNMGIANILGGNYPLLTLSPRHNSYRYVQQFADNFTALAMNRIFFAAASIILLLAAVYIYEQKRKGHLNVYEHFTKIFANFKNKSKT